MKSTASFFVLLSFLISQTLVVGAVGPSLYTALEFESDGSEPGSPDAQVQAGSFRIAQGARRNSFHRILNPVVTRTGAMKSHGKPNVPSIDASAPPHDSITVNVQNGGTNIGRNGGSIVIHNGQVQTATTPDTTATVIGPGEDPVVLGGEVVDENIPHNEARDNLKLNKRVRHHHNRAVRYHPTIPKQRKTSMAHTHTSSNLPPTATQS